MLLFTFLAWFAPHVVPSTSVQDFGAIPDDGLDDTMAIQAALDSVCSAGCGEVFFPEGVYDVSRPPGSGVPFVMLRLGCAGLTLRGDGAKASVLRVADGEGPFESLLASPTFGADVSGLQLVDLGFDGNGAANPIDGDGDLDDILREPRHALRVYVGQDIRVERCGFWDWRNLNVLTFNGVAVAGAVVRDCLFEDIGAAPGDFADWDHSSIYTDCDGAWIEGNTFRSAAGPGTFGVRAAIETHGPDQVVLDNRVRDFTTGINATGVSVLGSPGQRIQNNRFQGVSDGIRIWSFEVPSDPPGAEIQDMRILDNCIVVETDGWRGTQDAFGLPPTGISLVTFSDGSVDGLILRGNRIRFRPTVTTRPWDGLATGISLHSDTRPDIPLERVRILRNRIQGSLGTGMYLGGDLDDWVVRDNRIVGAGSGLSGVVNGFRSAAIVFGSYRDVQFTANCIQDRNQQLAQAFYLFEENQGNCSIRATGLLGAAAGLVFTRVDAPLQTPWIVEEPLERCVVPPGAVSGSQGCE